MDFGYGLYHRYLFTGVSTTPNIDRDLVVLTTAVEAMGPAIHHSSREVSDCKDADSH